MKRKIYKQLLKWKESKDRKPLMLLGARQVGKTWIMQHFGKKEYKNVAYIVSVSAFIPCIIQKKQ